MKKIIVILLILDASILACIGHIEIPTLKHYTEKERAIAQGGGSRINILAVGDSVGAGKMEATPFQEALGNSGYGLNSLSLTAGCETGNCTEGSDFAYWITGSYFNLGSGGVFVTYHVGVQISTTLKIYYIKQSGAGLFKVQSSSNNGLTWNDEAVVDAAKSSTPSGVGGIVTITKTAGNYRVRALGVSGSCKIIGGALLNSAPGAAEFVIARGGISLNWMVTTPTAIFKPIITDIAPDLAFFEMKDSAAIFDANLAIHQARFDEVAPNCDWVYIASNPVDPTMQNDDEQREQGEILDRFAMRHGQCCFDAYTTFVSYALMTERGWNINAPGAGDGVHPSAAGNAFAASVMVQQLGLFRDPLFAGRLGQINRSEARLSQQQQSHDLPPLFTSAMENIN